ncbi:TonB-dependent receptor [Hyphomicrobium sp.]|uniref:TonB-dependent receptor family protein n=1 Tax=Hyphomicrobium sp. TaxID=82 RepID=UPI0025C45E5F|nr:TonB-dependent receptor [Hyphomicrobium sp.]MCC7250823.1 TonB-dependent receptor [Hyphomicrobium sp.]
MASNRIHWRKAVLMASVACVASAPALAQQAAEPAEGLPEVEVIQKKTPAAKKKAAAPVAKKAAPAPSPTPQPPPEVIDEAPELANSPYGAANSGGAQARAEQSAQTPINPTQLIPQNLEGFSSAGTNLTPELLTERQPRNLNEAMTRVPGVIVVNDDGAGHHGGVSVRGSPPRRSRKMLIMEDGHTVNLALWLDPSVHYWAPIERTESVEVLRGTVITHGPNNNFGVINSRNLSPFGPDETVVSSAIGFTKNKTGSFTPIEIEDDGSLEFGDTVSRKSDTDISARWHVHTRQSVDNVGVVLSYTGLNAQGSWDTERLRVNDFYGALGWKGSSSDVVVSVTHARQKDSYDEQNFLGNYEIEGVNIGPTSGDDDEDEEAAVEIAEGIAEQFAGLAEQQFKLLKHCKTCFAPASVFNTYTGEVWRGQVVHNAYLDDDTTITSRFYAGYHRRDRYQLISPSAFPDNTLGDVPEIDDDEVIFGSNTMFGRLRTFRHVGGEVRGEWANQQLLGFKQDLQAGIRYEYQDMTNRNFLGADGEILKDGDDVGTTIFDRSLDANTVSAFLQSNIYVARDFNVVPGIRFEWFEVNRRNRVIAEEEGEAGEADDCPAGFATDDCLEIDGIDFDPARPRESFSSFNALPGIAFAYTGLKRTTVFGGYHRGLTTSVLRNENFPSPDEIGDNFNLGLRSTAIRGIDFEVVGFYQRLKDFQFGESFSSVTGDREFGRADEAEISGVELYGRLNSQPFTGGSLNFFAEANYTYSRGILKKAFTFEDDGSIDDDFSGNRIPEVPWHVAALTLGVEQNTGWRWDASVTWTYRGSFFTDAANTPYGFGGEVECEHDGTVAGDEIYECEIEEAGETGGVPDVWLLSARFNMDIGDTGASVWVAGDNLLDKLYITDREDGMKPGIGRTVWAGFKYTF